MQWRSEVVLNGDYELVHSRVAAAIHNNHGAPPDEVTCFMCRRDATKVLSDLHEGGFSMSRSVVKPVTVPLAAAGARLS